jgi:hypothetical protein
VLRHAKFSAATVPVDLGERFLELRGAAEIALDRVGQRTAAGISSPSVHEHVTP